MTSNLPSAVKSQLAQAAKLKTTPLMFGPRGGGNVRHGSFCLFSSGTGIFLLTAAHVLQKYYIGYKAERKRQRERGRNKHKRLWARVDSGDPRALRAISNRFATSLFLFPHHCHVNFKLDLATVGVWGGITPWEESLAATYKLDVEEALPRPKEGFPEPIQGEKVMFTGFPRSERAHQIIPYEPSVFGESYGIIASACTLWGSVRSVGNGYFTVTVEDQMKEGFDVAGMSGGPVLAMRYNGFIEQLALCGIVSQEASPSGASEKVIECASLGAIKEDGTIAGGRYLED
jgi:hypothetical protein